ncbi:unnamed protein product [Clonostachys byssicola]|uniref:Endonuclease/exonuclease/phosphatase domain-containing protein n=1 Tax=Clonostachys byssicola TaxID=160290 RepID=A0A9N9UG73_9HYPO|nr:unnamed protein product [Clonostachys byssicola]
MRVGSANVASQNWEISTGSQSGIISASFFSGTGNSAMIIPRISRTLSMFQPSVRRWVAAPPRLDEANVGQGVKSAIYSLSSWNINAFWPRPVARATAIINLLLSEAHLSSDIIFLQEVTREVRSSLLRDPRIRSNYLATDAEDTAAFNDVSFATMTLLSKARFSSQGATIGPVSRFKLPSQYGRDALCTDVFLPPSTASSSLHTGIEDCYRLRLVNVHLDSLSSTLSYRKQQMACVSEILHESDNSQTKQSNIGLVAGDFNAVCQEDQDLLTKNRLTDAWLQLYGADAAQSQTNTEQKSKHFLGPRRLDKVAISGPLESLELQNLCPGTIPVPKPGEVKDGEVKWSDHPGLRFTFKLP